MIFSLPFQADFDPRKIALSGQSFRAEVLPDESLLFFYKEYVLILRKTASCYECETNAPSEDIWLDYFDLRSDYASFIRKIPEDDTILREALRFSSGLRILRQDFFEVLLSFLISQNNNIPRIRKAISSLTSSYGEAMQLGEFSYHAFPEPQTLYSVSEETLRSMGLGYRAPYLTNLFKRLESGEFSIEELSSLPPAECRKTLLSLKGIGEKVADCILLYGRHDLTAFPVDTHIRKILSLYGDTGFPYQAPLPIGVYQQYLFDADLHGAFRRFYLNLL